MSNPSMSFNNKRNDDIYLLRGRSKSPYHPISRTIFRASNDFRLRKTEKELLPIQQPIGFVSKEDKTQIEIVERLTNWLVTDYWAVLSFDNEPDRRYLALLQNDMGDLERMAWLRQGTLQFIAKATLGETKSINVNTTATNHTITGQTETPWTIEVTFAEDTNRFEFWAGDVYLQLNYEFVEGDKLIINYTGRKVTLNGNDLRKAVSMSSNFVELEPGTVSIRASHAAKLIYDERYY